MQIRVRTVHHAQQRRRFSQNISRKWTTGRTCDVKFEFRIYENDAMLMICDDVDTFQERCSGNFTEIEHRAEQRSRFSRKTCRKCTTGRTCDAEFVFRRNENDAMCTLRGGVKQNSEAKTSSQIYNNKRPNLRTHGFVYTKRSRKVKICTFA